MATHTLVTAGGKSLTAVTFSYAPATLAQADLATICQGIKNDLTQQVIPGSFTREGKLFIPRRGVLQVLPGDVVATDDRGFVYLLSADTIANGTDWTLT